MSRVDELLGRTPGTKKPKSRIEELTGRGPSNSGVNRLDELTGKGLTAVQQSESLPVLEQQAQEVGAPAPAQDSPGAFRRIVDVISRPNYAVAGAAEEAFAPQGGGLSAVPGRVVSELFSGIGGLKGQKEGFGQVMEQAGVGEMGSLSDIAPWLYSESGKGLALEKGGIADPTGRGTLGLAGDIVLDPLTYVNPSKAIARIPGAKSLGSAIASTVKSVPAFDAAIEAVGNVFDRDWKIRKLPGARGLKQAHLNRQNHATGLLHEELANSKMASIPKGERAAFVDAMDQGTWAERYKNNPKMLETAQEFKAINDGWAAKEVEHGFLKPESVRENYVAHFYDNTPAELNKIRSLWPVKGIPGADLGRHKELRAFDTLTQAENWTKAQHAIDPSVPILKPVRDPLEIMRRRGEASIKALEFRQYYDELANAFGKKDIPFSPENLYNLATEIPTHPVESMKINGLIKAGKVPIEEFRKLSQTGKQEFVRQRLLRSKEPSEILGVLKKYGPDHAPKQLSLIGTLAEDGTPYVKFNSGRLKDVELPASLASELQGMTEKVLNGRELSPILEGFDKINNTFKSFVTVMFPAFHFRNAYSNIAQGFADVGVNMLNPFRHYDAVASLRGLEGDLVTKAGERIPYRQIQDEMARNGVTTTGRRLAEYTGKEGIDRLSTVGGKIKAAPRAFGGAVENEARSALYTIHRRRGLSAVDAAQQVNKVLFDYTNLSKVEQEFFRRAIPFYTWQKKNIVQQFRNLATKPGLTAAELKPFRGRDNENDMLTSWDAEALKIRINSDGKTLRVLSGVDLPVRNLDLLWNGDLRSTIRQGIGVLSPIVKAPMEVGFGVSAFTGRQIDRQTSNSVGRVIETLNPPKAIQQWMGYKKEVDKAGRPKYTFDGQRFYILFQSWALSRIVSTSDRQFKTFSESPEWSRIMLDTLTGLRQKEFNLSEEQQKRMDERTKQLEQNLIRWGQRREFKRVYQPKAAP